VRSYEEIRGAFDNKGGRRPQSPASGAGSYCGGLPHSLLKDSSMEFYNALDFVGLVARFSIVYCCVLPIWRNTDIHNERMDNQFFTETSYAGYFI